MICYDIFVPILIKTKIKTNENNFPWEAYMPVSNFNGSALKVNKSNGQNREWEERGEETGSRLERIFFKAYTIKQENKSTSLNSVGWSSLLKSQP